MADLTDFKPLNILVVGAGIGGLTAALGLRKNGHHVTVYEQSSASSELGAAVIFAPNANGILIRLGIDVERDGAVPRQWHTDYTASGQLLDRTNLTKTAGLWQHHGVLCLRAEVHKALLTAGTSAEGVGPPVKVHLNSRVIDVFPESAMAVFQDGSKVKADMVIGADGVKSITRTKLHDVKPFPSGKSAFRFLVDRNKALCNPMVGDIVNRDGDFSIWYGRDRRIWMYTTHFNQLLNLVCLHPDALSKVEDSRDAFGTSVGDSGNKARMMEIFKEFDPRLISLIEMADPSSVRLWQLLDMDPPPTRCKGNLCLLGDAALPFLPHIGQGAACALEDAASLTAIFGPGTSPEDIPEKLKLYEDCRRGRAEELHFMSRQLGRDLEPGNDDAHTNRNAIATKYFPVIFSYDEFDHTTQKLREKIQDENSPRWSMPSAFGPKAVQDKTILHKAQLGAPSYVRSSIKFKTSRTLLQNLIPRLSLTFSSPGSIAYASLVQTTWSKVDWLGGRGFNELAFYIHGLEGVIADGSRVYASFLAVAFADSAESIVNDREEHGIPKVFCEFDIEANDSIRVVKASWHGATFALMRLHGLRKSPAIVPTGDELEPIFTHHYVPALGNEDKALADTIVHLSSTTSSESDKLHHKAAKGEVEFVAQDSRALPTLHHIAARLAELPVLAVVDSSSISGTGQLRYTYVATL